VITPDIPVRRFANACWWLLRALTHDGIVEALVDSARELTGADAAFFAGRDGDDLRITAASGLSNPDLARSWRLPVGAGITGWCVAHAESATIGDYATDPRRTSRDTSIVDGEGVRSGVVIPVRGFTDVLGALCVVHRTPVDPAQWPLEALELLVRQAASLDVVVVFELQRMAEKAATSPAEPGPTIEVLPGLLARRLASRAGLGGGLQLLAERLAGSVVLAGPDGAVLERADTVGAAPPAEGADAVRTDVTVDAGSAPLAELRFSRQRPLRCAERRVLEQCASVIALELLRQRSVFDAEERLGCELFRELVDGGVEDEGGLRHRASLLGLNLGVARAVLRVGRHLDSVKQDGRAGLGDSDVGHLLRAARTLSRAAAGWISATDVVLVVDVPGASETDVRQLARKLLRAASTAGGTRFAAGIGRLCTELDEYPRAAREAEMALAMARVRPLPNEVVTRGELGICALLVTSSDAGELVNLVLGVLAPLLAVDTRSGSDYVHTLSVFHACDRHVATAAQRLHIHVNTLRHRLRKIEQILDIDLGDADTRFMLEFALRVHETVRPAGAA
jgi:sugar diacid utilization regulator